MLAALIAAGAAIRICDLFIPYAQSADESVYRMEAATMADRGLIAGNIEVTRAFLRDDRLLPYPPPTRVGWTVPMAVMMRISGARDSRPGTWISAVMSILTLGLTAMTGLEFFGLGATIAALALLAVFPPDLVVASRCWTDATTAFYSLLVVYLTMSVTRGRVRLVPVLAAAGTVGVLAKETFVLIYAPCLAIAGIALIRQKRPVWLWTLAGMSLTLAALAFGILHIFTSGREVDLILRAVAQHSRNAYAVAWQTGPPYLLAEALWLLSPLTVSLGFLGLVLAMIQFRGSPVRFGLAAGALGMLLFYALMPHVLNVRYVSPVFAPLCLFAGSAIQRIHRAVGALTPRTSKLAAALGTCALVIFLLSDYLRFRDYYRHNLVDLSVKAIVPSS